VPITVSPPTDLQFSTSQSNIEDEGIMNQEMIQDEDPVFDDKFDDQEAHYQDFGKNSTTAIFNEEVPYECLQKKDREVAQHVARVEEVEAALRYARRKIAELESLKVEQEERIMAAQDAVKLARREAQFAQERLAEVEVSAACRTFKEAAIKGYAAQLKGDLENDTTISLLKTERDEARRIVEEIRRVIV